VVGSWEALIKGVMWQGLGKMKRRQGYVACDCSFKATFVVSIVESSMS